MEKAGIPLGHGLDRKRHEKGSIDEEEAMNIVAFFDRDGDGLLSYAEFMSCLQTTKTSVLATKILSHR
jgi:Ca2+-binding EF-hand superfamily protein